MNVAKAFISFQGEIASVYLETDISNPFAGKPPCDKHLVLKFNAPTSIVEFYIKAHFPKAEIVNWRQNANGQTEPEKLLVAD